jgi:outer membrane protein OmpA-like peptidoglycan-associated protein
MADDQSHESVERERVQRTEKVETADSSSPGMAGEFAYPATPAYPVGLLGSSRLDGRGNAPVRAGIIQRMQQTHGNRAVQRFLRVQRNATSTPAAQDDDIAHRIESRAGGGASLDTGVQTTLEQGLGADLSGVRVHTDGEADHLARSVDSVAFTTGSDIFFRQGAYNPSTPGGMHLLAHEVTHTVQQASGPVAGTPSAGGVSISEPSDQFEQAAEQTASNIVSGKPAAIQASGRTSPPASVQREEKPEDEEELPHAQTMRASANVQRAAMPGQDEEDEAVQTMRESTASIALQRAEDPSYAGAGLAGLQNRGPTVVQRSMAGSFPVTQGIFEMGMETQDGAVAGTGPSGLKGTIQFVPSKDSPYSNHIALQQIVKLSDAGGANVNPVSLPTATGAEIRTKEDKAGGVEGGFFTDVLHNDAFGTKKDAPKGQFLSLNYPFSSTGSQVLGFKRSEEASDIKAAELFDFPGTADKTAKIDFSFETVAKGTDSGNVYGAVKWAFGLRDGKVTNEDGPHVDDVASPTFNSAVEKHQDFYVHEPTVFHFGFDSDELESGEEGKINTSLLDYLRRFPDVRLSLRGFADQRGNAAYNKQLSVRRGNRVAQAYIAAGVSADRINPIAGKGATTSFTPDAVGDQDREANRQGNRTVVCEYEHTASIGSTP